MTSYRFRFSLLLLLLSACGFCLMLATASDASAQSGGAPADGSVVAVAAGETHTCLLTGEGAVWCWGANSYGQLGDGTRTNRRVPVAVIGLTSGVQAIAVGGHHTCAVTGGGDVLCWGRNNYGQLGDGTTYLRTQPVAVRSLAQATSVTAGYAHTCAGRADGAAVCWGSNTSGQLGDNTTISRRTPVLVNGLTQVRTIAAGGAHSCASLDDGSVRCWGNNYSGQLGDGTRIYRRTPVAVNGLGIVRAIDAGGSHTCALDMAGALACWGNNYYGQLGDGTTVQRLAPVAMNGLVAPVHSFSTGLVHTCMVQEGGAAACVGWNAYGQLGDGTLTNRSRPVGVSELSAVTAIVAAGGLGSAAHSCAVADGGLKCWGKNTYGQVGDNTLVQRTAPVAVVQPVPPPTYALGGQVTDELGVPLAGVTLAMPGGALALTDASGVYTLPNLKPGVYQVAAAMEGYRFVPESHSGLVVPPTQTAVDFVAAPVPVEAFSLDLPFPYTGTPEDFARLVQNWSDGGRTTSWFDHAYPDYSINDVIWTYNQRVPLPAPATGIQANRCAQNVCYDGHNGIDFARNYAVSSGTPILAAAAGQVVLVTTGCIVGDARCASGWGNQVVLAHTGDATYFTRYAHLATVDVAVGQQVATGAALGMMGTTGNSTGIHLHFGVYRDDGDGIWEDRTYDKPLDPFGWQASVADPWVADRGGAVSTHLWRHAARSESTLLAAAAEPDFIPPDELMGAAADLAGFAEAPPDEASASDTWQTVVDTAGVVTVSVPPLAFIGQLSLALEPVAAPAPTGAWRPVGSAYRLQPVQVVGDLAGRDVAQLTVAVAELTAGLPLSIAVRYADADLRHVASDALSLFRWDVAQQQWLPLLSATDMEQQTASAGTLEFGTFQLQGPLRCADDASEPDDNDYAATVIVPGDEPALRLFDSPADEDWLRVDLDPAASYIIDTTGAPAVDGAWTLFDQDGSTPLASGELGAVDIFAPPHAGSYYLRVAPAQDAVVVDCDALYTLRVAAITPQVFLPLIDAGVPENR
ncbi:MAG TPA: peptidoglycan DD-metalloendopeptidase family protein [Caldilinea sp.]|nr:peptidoglycan DD-metalloendopeptidase family protein [Caldilinea sp.]